MASSRRAADEPSGGLAAALARARRSLALRDGLLEVAAAAVSTRDMAHAALQLVQRAIACRRASLVLFDFEAREATLLAAHGEVRLGAPPSLAWAAECGLVDRLARGERVRHLLDLRRRQELLAALRDRSMAGCLTVPLVAQDDLVGSLNLRPRGSGGFSAAERELAGEVAAQLAIAFQNARHFEVERRERRVGELLRAANRSFSSSLEVGRVLDAFLDYLTQAAPADLAAVLLPAAAGGPPVLRAFRADEPWSRRADLEQALTAVRRSPVGRRWLAGGAPHLVQDTQLEEAWPQHAGTSSIRCWLGDALRVDRQRVGFYCLARLDARSFSESQVEVSEALAAQAAVALENAGLFEEVRAARERLAALSGQLVTVQEAERRQIARELHDEVGQTLTGLKLILDAAARAPDARSARLDEAGRLMQTLMGQVREMSLELRPAMLDDLGLVPSLLWLFDRYTSSTGVKVTLRHSGGGRRFGTDIETAVYRVAQEALTNIARHAAVQKAMVRLGIRRGLLRLEVSDAGRGFEASDGPTGRTGGLLGMRERVALLGGRLKIVSAPGRGTRLVAVLPVRE